MPLHRNRRKSTSPPRHDPGEALFKEAKQRARRRRWIYGAAATVVAIAAVAAFTIPTSGTAPPNDATPHVPAPPAVPLGAPLVQGPDSASTLLTSWGQTHVGYILVYADGRVLFTSDGLGALADFLPFSGIAERHLSARGLDLVRAGTFDPKEIVEELANRHLSARELDLVFAGTFDPKEIVERLGRGWLPSSPYGREELWVEPTAHAHMWEPTAYALCPGSGGKPPATDVVDKLPADVQLLLDGRQHLYDPLIGTGHWIPPAIPPAASWSNYTGIDLSGWDCFAVTAAELSTLPNALGYGRFNYDGVSLYAWPIFPHGQPVIWGG